MRASLHALRIHALRARDYMGRRFWVSSTHVPGGSSRACCALPPARLQRVGHHRAVKSTLLRWLLMICTFVLVLGLGECVLRNLPGDGPSGDPGLRALHRVEPGAPWLYGPRPGATTTLTVSGDTTYEINAAGHRGPEVDLARVPGSERIVVIGDSLAFGYGVAEAETFARRLEARLSEDGDTEVVNLGVSGYGPFNEAAWLEGRGMRYAPDVVLVQFCINDLNDPTLHFDAATRGALGELPDAAFPGGERVARANPCGPWEICRRLRAIIAPDDSLQILRSMAAIDLKPGPHREWLRDRYAEMVETAGLEGARVVIVGFPHPAQLESGQGVDLQGQLAEVAAEVGAGFIDLLPAFEQAAVESDAPLFFDLYHPTSRGHAVAAEAIADALDDASPRPPARDGAIP